MTESWLKDFSGFSEPLRHARIFDEFALYKTEFLDLKGRLGKSDFVSRNKSTTWLGGAKDWLEKENAIILRSYRTQEIVEKNFEGTQIFASHHR